jgi:hypothetical protein
MPEVHELLLLYLNQDPLQIRQLTLSPELLLPLLQFLLPSELRKE